MEKIKPELTKVSSKGQLVIPQAIRTEMKIKEGSVFAVMHPKKDTLILKRIKIPINREDLDILNKIEKAWKDIEKGKYKKYVLEDFLKKLKKW